MALKSGYGNFLLWLYFSEALVQTFTSTTIIDEITDLTLHWVNACTVMTYHSAITQKCYLVSFADIVWLKVPPCIVYISKTFRYRKLNYI